MGRRRKKHAHFTPRSVDIDADVDDVDLKSSKFFYDEIDHFHAKQDGIDLSDASDLDVPKKQNISKASARKYHDESDDSVMNEDDTSSEEEEDVSMEQDYDSNDNDDLGFEGEDDDTDNEKPFADIPSSKAWGKKTSAYYGGENVKDVRGLDREDLEDAEEEEALKIQQRLAEEIDEDQFDFFKLSGMGTTENEAASQKVEKVDIDIHSLSTKAQWKLLKQESPELRELILDFKIKSKELTSQLIPLLDMVKAGKIIDSGAVYVQTKFNLYVSYLLNISFYMSLKVKRADLTGHPVIKRLAQYRTLINKLSRLDRKLENQIELLLQDNENFSTTPNIIENLNDDAYEGDEEEISEPNDRISMRNNNKKQIPISTEQSYVPLDERIRLEKEKQKQVQEPDKMKQDNNLSDEETDDRRAVPDKIKKNRGYVNKRKKKFGNPRVKHKEKYRKAKIQRKAIVREFRPELQKYSGETTGIKAGLIRSRPIR